MIAVDTDILVYAYRAEVADHVAARAALSELHAGSAPWAIPWSCVHELLNVLTHPRIYDPPAAVDVALDLMAWIGGDPQVVVLGESRDHARILDRLVRTSGVRGPKIHDARIAAICLGHGVSELWSADRDFSRFPELRVVNPLPGRR